MGDEDGGVAIDGLGAVNFVNSQHFLELNRRYSLDRTHDETGPVATGINYDNNNVGLEKPVTNWAKHGEADAEEYPVLRRWRKKVSQVAGALRVIAPEVGPSTPFDL